MKKHLALLLALVLMLTLAACVAATPQSAAVPTDAPTEAVVIEEISITLDNWQEYFEMREAQRVQVSAAGEISLREFGYGVMLKEEYAARLAEDNPVDVSFDMQVDSVRMQVYGDLNTDNFIVRDDTLHNEGIRILNAEVEDYRGNERIQPDSDFHNAVGAFFTVEGEFGA